MRKFLIKASVLAFVCFNTTQMFGAEAALISIEGEITANMPTAKLPFASCVLDFSNPQKEAFSASKLVLTLAAGSDSLSVPHVLYLLCEGIAAESRAKPASLGKVSEFLNTHTSSNTNAVYEAFEKINGAIKLGTTTVTTVFASQDSCNLFVTQSINVVIPALLKAMNAEEDITQLAVLGADTAAPMISTALFTGYQRAHEVVKNVHLETISVNVAGGGGCFGCGSSKRK